jgi:hypothetical protein
VGGGPAELSKTEEDPHPDAVGVAREHARPARRRRAACAASSGSRRMIRQAAPASRLQATRRIGGHGVASPRI